MNQTDHAAPIGAAAGNRAPDDRENIEAWSGRAAGGDGVARDCRLVLELAVWTIAMVLLIAGAQCVDAALGVRNDDLLAALDDGRIEAPAWMPLSDLDIRDDEMGKQASLNENDLDMRPFERRGLKEDSFRITSTVDTAYKAITAAAIGQPKFLSALRLWGRRRTGTDFLACGAMSTAFQRGVASSRDPSEPFVYLRRIAAQEPAESARILVVDDEPSIREVLAQLLDSEGYTTRTVRNVADALTLLEHTAADLIVSDVRIPVIDGPSLVRALRDRGDTTPVVLVRALPTECGLPGVYCLGRPLNMEELLGAIRAMLSGHRPSAS
jgi:hypothetical protein